MAMWNETSLEIIFEDGEDHSDEVKSCFSMTTLEDEPSMLIYNKSFSRNENSYNLEYHERGYFDHNEMLRKVRDLASELPHSPFSLSVGVFNEGSGGNYHDEFQATYKYGALDWKYYCDYEQEDRWDAPPQLVRSDKEQLFPQIDFIQDIAEDEKKEQMHKEREHLLQTGIIKNIENKVFITTGLSVEDEQIIRGVVERSGGVFKEKFVKGIDYLVYNPNYGRETTKLRDANALIAEGKDVKVITLEHFKELLFSASVAKNAPAAAKTSNKAKKSDTKVYKLNSKVSLDLPKGYQVVKGKSEDGTDTVTIFSKPYKDDNGEKQYRFACGINDYTVEYKDSSTRKKKLSGRALLEETVKDIDGIHYFFLAGEPAGMMLCKVAGANADDSSATGMLANILILMGRPFSLNLRIAVDDHTLMEFLCMGSAAFNDDPDYMPKFEGIMTVAQSLRINGEPLHLGKLTPKILESAFSPKNLDYKESADITSKLKKVMSENTDRKVVKASSASISSGETDSGLFPVAEVEPNRRKLLDRKPEKADNLNCFDLYLHTWESSPGVALYYYDKLWPAYSETKSKLLRAADELVKLFRNEGLVCDVESELRQGYIRKGRILHVFRSFVWTSVEYCKETEKDLSWFDTDQLLQLAQFIFDRGGANYKPIDKKTTRIGAGLFAKSEKDYSIYGESYFNMISSLYAFVPIMNKIHDLLINKQADLTDAEVTLKDVLAGWCVFSFACFGEFKVEAGPEDYVPEKCWNLPIDAGKLRVINKDFYVDQDNVCVAYTGSGDTIEFPEGVEMINIPEKYNDISGSKEYWSHAGTVVFPKTYRGRGTEYATVNDDCPKYMKHLVVKGPIDTIKSKYVEYKGTAYLEELEFLGTGNSVARYAFSSEYSRLRKVVLPENLSVIEKSAFHSTPRLKEIRIPPNVREIGVDAFKQYDGSVKILIVDRGSPAESVVARFVEGRKDLTYRVVLSEAEQKRIDEENRLKKIASTISQKLEAIYKDTLDETQYDVVKKEASDALVGACDKQTWNDLYKTSFLPLPENLKETSVKLSSATSAEDAYDSLPGWIATEYIGVAETKQARLMALLSKKNADLESIRLEEERLKEERAHLGLFQGKRKREIAALLEAIPNRIKQVNEEYERAKSKV